MKERPPAMEGSCEYIVLQLGVLLGKSLKSLRPGWILWINDPSNGIQIWDMDYGM
jgi:hypothetical protein